MPRLIIKVTDRYAALRSVGLTHNGCKGPCEGMGIYPKKDPTNPKADEIGYVFVKCPVCKGRKRRA